MNGEATGEEDRGAENNFSGVEEGVLLELLVPRGGVTMAFRWIDDATAGDALGFGRKTGDPAESNDG
jgi:hypothetical protein